jgi:hypothetical protein
MSRDLTAALADYRATVARLLEVYPDETEESLADTIEGATDLDQAILATLREALWREAQGDAVQTMIDTLIERRNRLILRAKVMRQAAAEAMTEAGMKSLAAPDMTVSVRAGQPKAVVTDEALLPEMYWRVRTIREPDKRAIADSLSFEEVPGAHLSNAPPVLTIRRK